MSEDVPKMSAPAGAHRPRSRMKLPCLLDFRRLGPGRGRLQHNVCVECMPASVCQGLGSAIRPRSSGDSSATTGVRASCGGAAWSSARVSTRARNRHLARTPDRCVPFRAVNIAVRPAERSMALGQGRARVHVAEHGRSALIQRAKHAPANRAPSFGARLSGDARSEDMTSLDRPRGNRGIDPGAPLCADSGARSADPPRRCLCSGPAVRAADLPDRCSSEKHRPDLADADCPAANARGSIGRLPLPTRPLADASMPLNASAGFLTDASASEMNASVAVLRSDGRWRDCLRDERNRRPAVLEGEHR